MTAKHPGVLSRIEGYPLPVLRVLRCALTDANIKTSTFKNGKVLMVYGLDQQVRDLPWSFWDYPDELLEEFRADPQRFKRVNKAAILMGVQGC